MDTNCPGGTAQPATPRSGPGPRRPEERRHPVEKGWFERGAGPGR
ncbi:hypothetical protein [Streptomyces sp. NRRL B-1347]|nr:hypothetical protein [Streptomyces sp. NRRL B-1347]